MRATSLVSCRLRDIGLVGYVGTQSADKPASIEPPPEPFEAIKNPSHQIMNRKQSEQDDPFDLARFLFAQEHIYDRALSEMRMGQKESHWMWFIFPQLEGLGRSSTAREFAIRSLDEARAYLGHPVLGPRLLECCRALLSQDGKSASDIMGFPDDIKLNSSMTLFSRVAGSHSEFGDVIEKYFSGRPDARTLGLLTH